MISSIIGLICTIANNENKNNITNSNNKVIFNKNDIANFINAQKIYSNKNKPYIIEYIFNIIDNIYILIENIKLFDVTKTFFQSPFFLKYHSENNTIINIQQMLLHIKNDNMEKIIEEYLPKLYNQFCNCDFIKSIIKPINTDISSIYKDLNLNIQEKAKTLFVFLKKNDFKSLMIFMDIIIDDNTIANNIVLNRDPIVEENNIISQKNNDLVNKYKVNKKKITEEFNDNIEELFNYIENNCNSEEEFALIYNKFLREFSNINNIIKDLILHKESDIKISAQKITQLMLITKMLCGFTSKDNCLKIPNKTEINEYFIELEKNKQLNKSQDSSTELIKIDENIGEENISIIKAKVPQKNNLNCSLDKKNDSIELNNTDSFKVNESTFHSECFNDNNSDKSIDNNDNNDKISSNNDKVSDKNSSNISNNNKKTENINRDRTNEVIIKNFDKQDNSHSNINGNLQAPTNLKEPPCESYNSEIPEKKEVLAEDNNSNNIKNNNQKNDIKSDIKNISLDNKKLNNSTISHKLPLNTAKIQDSYNNNQENKQILPLLTFVFSSIFGLNYAKGEIFDNKVISSKKSNNKISQDSNYEQGDMGNNDFNNIE